MNERIDKLMYHAGLTAQGCWDEMDEYDRKAIEKFAELIVQECMNAVCDPSTTYLESMTDASAMYTARERIRKHFRS
jgi:TRAP-type C4-dicarboxylate transport system substrate-binding protein